MVERLTMYLFPAAPSPHVGVCIRRLTFQVEVLLGQMPACAI